MKVLLLNIAAQLGGTERVVLDMVRHLPDRGIDLRVVVPVDGPLVEVVREAGGDIHVVPAPAEYLSLGQRAGPGIKMAGGLGGAITWARAIEGAGLDVGCDLLYTHGFKTHLSGSCMNLRPWIWHLHELPPSGIGRLWAGILDTATGAIAISDVVAGAWGEMSGANITRVYNGVDMARFKPLPGDGWLRRRLGLPEADSAPLVGMPAVLTEWKGHLAAVAAMRTVREQIPDARLVIVGSQIYDTSTDADYGERLRNEIDRAGGSDAGIHTLPFVDEVERLYPEFDLTVSYSLRPEPFGRVIVESLACGTPVIAAAEGGPAEILRDAPAAGLLVPPREPAQLAEGILRALGADSGVSSAGALARARDFSVDRFADGIAQGLVGAARGLTTD